MCVRDAKRSCDMRSRRENPWIDRVDVRTRIVGQRDACDRAPAAATAIQSSHASHAATADQRSSIDHPCGHLPSNWLGMHQSQSLYSFITSCNVLGGPPPQVLCMHSREYFVIISIKVVPLHCGSDSIWTNDHASGKQQIILTTTFEPLLTIGTNMLDTNREK